MTITGKDTTPTQWIMWAAGVLLTVVVVTIPSGLNTRIDSVLAAQADMKKQHSDLLKIAVVQCYNSAENQWDLVVRRKQQQRCLNLTIEEAR